MTISDEFLAAWDALPEGSFDAVYRGRRYGVTRTERNGGRQAWLWAEELGGSECISANLYRLQSGARLKPCEMPAEKVVAFVLGAVPCDAGDGRAGRDPRQDESACADPNSLIPGRARGEG